MKFLLLAVFLSFNISVAGASSADSENCSHCKEELSGQPTNGVLKDIERIAKHDNRFGKLGQLFCLKYVNSGDFKEQFNGALERHMDYYAGITNPTPKQKVTYLNKHKDKLICGSGKNKKNYMMYAFDEGAHMALFYKVFRRDYIAKDRTARIDVNAVSFTGPKGKPETVLDYMNNILADKSNDEGYLKQVSKIKRYSVKKLGAKKFSEFDSATQSKYQP